MWVPPGSKRSGLHVCKANRIYMACNCLSAHYAGKCVRVFEIYQILKEDGIEPSKIIFLCILKACGSIGDADQSWLIHKEIIRSGLELETVIGSSLVNMYVKGGNLFDARKVFDELPLPSRNIMSWGAIFAGHAEHGHRFSALQLLEDMQEQGIKPDKVMFLRILKACSSIRAIRHGIVIHNHVVESEFDLDLNIGNALVDMYGKCGNLQEARKVFNILSRRNEVSWGAMIAGYAQHGYGFSALELYGELLHEGIRPGKVVFLCILKACGSIGEFGQGKMIHNHIIEHGLESDLGVGSTLIDMYAKCGSLEDAQKMFNKLPNRNVVSWSAIIAGYAENGCGFHALELFEKMQEEGVIADRVTYLCTLKACASIGALEQGMKINDHILKSNIDTDVVIGSTLIDMYAKCGRLEEAQKICEELPVRNSVSWGALIAGYVQHGHNLSALEAFEKMQQEGINPDKVAFSCALKACGSIGEIERGKLIHDVVYRSGVRADVVVGNASIHMYAKCGALKEACAVFENLKNRNEVSWNAIITGYSEHGHGHLALRLFEEMHEDGIMPNRVTFLCILKACGSIEAVGQGKLIHDHIMGTEFETDVVIASVLVDMYAKCGCLEDARTIFDKLSSRNVVSWNAMIAGYVKWGNLEDAQELFDNFSNRDVISWNAIIAGYAQHGLSLSALDFFEKMEQEGVKPDKVTFLCILKACGSLGAISRGRWINDEINKSGLDSDVVIGNTLVDMYGTCGSLRDAHKVFNDLPNPDAASWGAIISAHTQQGNFECVGQCFQDMQKQGLKPIGMTYTSMLAACSHMVRMEEGYNHFETMRDNLGIIPCTEHINCMVDLLGRAGCLNEAEAILQTMPIPSDMTGWMSLLIACRMHGNRKLGRKCFDQAMHLDPSIASGYVLLSNIYADAQLWGIVHKVEGLRTCVGALKKIGRAWVEIDSIYEFVVGSRTHKQSNNIYAKIQRLTRLMKLKQHVPQLNLVLEKDEGEGESLTDPRGIQF